MPPTKDKQEDTQSPHTGGSKEIQKNQVIPESPNEGKKPKQKHDEEESGGDYVSPALDETQIKLEQA